jgi:hypothetical protein
MKALTLFIPGMSRLAGSDLRDAAAAYPRFARLLGRAHAVARDAPPEAALLGAFGLPTDFASARLTARIDLPPAEAAEDLLRCDPVYLHADPNKVLLYAAPGLEDAEADALLTSLRRDFPELGLRRGVQAGRWYLRRPSDIDGRAPSVHWLNGRSLSPHLPQAREHRSWRQLLNELQMALHDHPVNEARAARGLPPVNGLWIFGGGADQGEVSRADACPIACCFGNDVLLAGAASACGIPWQPDLPAPATALQARGQQVLILAGSGFGRVAAQAGVTLDAVETTLLSAVPPGFAQRWTIQGADDCWTSTPGTLLRFWRPSARFALDAMEP